MNDEERRIIHAVLRDLDEIYTRLVAEYPVALLRHRTDEAAFAHMLKFVEVGRETGYLTEKMMMGLVAYMVRRQSYDSARLVESLN